MPVEDTQAVGQHTHQAFPATPAGVVAVRSLRYWRRDPRHVIGLVSIVMMPVIIVGSNYMIVSANGGPGADGGLFMAVPVLGLAAGLGLISELSYDGSALWTHITTGLPGRSDRWGRVWAFLVCWLPMLLVALLTAGLLAKTWTPAVPALAAGLGLGLVGMGTSSLFGALWQGSTPPAGDNPFNVGSGGNGAALLSLLVAMVATAVLGAPVIWLAVRGLDDPVWAWGGLAGSLAWGALVLYLDCQWGGSHLDRRWPEVLKAVTYEKR